MDEIMWLHQSLDYWARIQPDAELAVHDGRSMSYHDAAARVDRMAGALAAALGRGARVAMLSKNAIDLVLLYFAASKAGVVPVPMNYRLAPPEWAYILNDCGATLVLAQPELAEGIDEVRQSTPALRTRVSLGEPLDAAWTPIDRWLEEPLTADAARERRHRELLQFYTSGTTGRPKGAILTQASVFNLLYQMRMCLPFGVGERLLLVTPIYHVGGAFNAFHTVGHGASMFMTTDFDAADVVRALDEERITLAFLVPSMIQACLAVPDVADRAYERFRLLYYGASPIAEPTLRKALGIFHCDFVQAFGMTECPNVTYLTAEDHRMALAGSPHLLESTGRAGPGSMIKIVDEAGAEVLPGTVGEICGRGPQTMQGYWNLPDATASALRDGWMHTGDAGTLDPEGYLYVKDRLKDMIVSGAENIYPREVENVLFDHADVVDVAVIGVPSEQWGETVKAVVVRRPGSSVTETELIDHCRGKLAAFKRPRSVDFVDEIPRNPSGKALKRILREPYWREHTRNVS